MMGKGRSRWGPLEAGQQRDKGIPRWPLGRVESWRSQVLRARRDLFAESLRAPEVTPGCHPLLPGVFIPFFFFFLVTVKQLGPPGIPSFCFFVILAKEGESQTQV